MPSDSQYVVTVPDRTALLQGPLGAVLMLSGDRTGGQLSLVELPLAPRALGSPVHTHRDEDEYSVVLEGSRLSAGLHHGDHHYAAGDVRNS
jgi:hypothetical protein